METSNNAIINQSRYEIHTVNLNLVIYVLAHIIISKKFSKRKAVCKIRTKEKRKLTKRKYSNESIQIFKDKVYMMLKFNREINNEQHAKVKSYISFPSSFRILKQITQFIISYRMRFSIIFELLYCTHIKYEIPKLLILKA
jgi:hypothetical protein